MYPCKLGVRAHSLITGKACLYIQTPGLCYVCGPPRPSACFIHLCGIGMPSIQRPSTTHEHFLHSYSILSHLQARCFSNRRPSRIPRRLEHSIKHVYSHLLLSTRNGATFIVTNLLCSVIYNVVGTAW